MSMMRAFDLTAEEVRARLSYDPETGTFVWNPRPILKPQHKSWNTRYAGRVAGCYKKHNLYVTINIDGRHYHAHRLAWLVVYGYWPESEIDHINCDRQNNKISEIREATKSQNLCNRPRQRNNTSGFKGVSWHKGTGSWRAYIKVSGRFVSLGYFKTAEAAAVAYEAASAQIFGQFARAA